MVTSENELDIGRWIREAGPRPELPAAQAKAILDAARAEWRAALGESPRMTARRWLAAAAGVALATMALGWWWRASHPGAPAVQAGRLERWQGEVRIAGLVRLAPGASIAAGSRLEIGAHGALALATGGRSLRFDAASAARLEGAAEITLERGALYVDGLPGVAAPSLVVRTPLGEVRELGTQFEVRLQDGAEQSLRVRVREGRIAVATRVGNVYASAGEELRVRRDGAAERATIAPDAEDWRWVVSAAPPFTLEGATLGAFLDWLARETGWRVEFADAELERVARRIVLHGTIEGLSPEEALAVVVEGSGLEFRREAGTVRFER